MGQILVQDRTQISDAYFEVNNHDHSLLTSLFGSFKKEQKRQLLKIKAKSTIEWYLHLKNANIYIVSDKS